MTFNEMCWNLIETRAFMFALLSMSIEKCTQYLICSFVMNINYTSIYIDIYIYIQYINTIKVLTIYIYYYFHSARNKALFNYIIWLCL